MQAMLKNSKALNQINALDKFYKTMALDNDRVAYGAKYVVEVRLSFLISLGQRVPRHRHPADQRQTVPTQEL